MKCEHPFTNASNLVVKQATELAYIWRLSDISCLSASVSMCLLYFLVHSFFLPPYNVVNKDSVYSNKNGRTLLALDEHMHSSFSFRFCDSCYHLQIGIDDKINKSRRASMLKRYFGDRSFFFFAISIFFRCSHSVHLIFCHARRLTMPNSEFT